MAARSNTPQSSVSCTVTCWTDKVHFDFIKQTIAATSVQSQCLNQGEHHGKSTVTKAAEAIWRETVGRVSFSVGV